MRYKNIAGGFFGLVTKHASVGRTDGQNYDSQDRASIAASRGKNYAGYFVLNFNVIIRLIQLLIFFAISLYSRKHCVYVPMV